MLLARPSAITPEDENPLGHFGEEASQPDDKGVVPAEEDQGPRDLTPEQLAEEEASASAGDLEFSEEGTEQ